MKVPNEDNEYRKITVVNKSDLDTLYVLNNTTFQKIDNNYKALYDYLQIYYQKQGTEETPVYQEISLSQIIQRYIENNHSLYQTQPITDFPMTIENKDLYDYLDQWLNMKPFVKLVKNFSSVSDKKAYYAYLPITEYYNTNNDKFLAVNLQNVNQYYRSIEWDTS